MIGEAYENQREFFMIMERQLEFATYHTAISGMSGKPFFKGLKKPSDLRPLPSDKIIEVKKKKELIIPDKETRITEDP